MKHHPLRTLSLTVAIAGLLGVGGHAVAQQQGDFQGQQQQPPGMDQQQAPQVDPQTLDRFVDAFVAVQHIRDDFAEQLQDVTDEAEAQALQQEAQEEMINAVQQEGMSVDEYNQVAMSLQNDPAMLQQVQEMAAERM
ncbi:hypothetical protein M911_00135 [Ectothiorhodospira haloalkaliphila]|uniref:DUF4168 domain-containing protein n=1 Tax=Ectothiorhodospira haloalkaliphila TaxID=421628 RepID=W8KDL7_9GAMM|nr:MULTISPECIES: DUF4168 domain-containing protein [Ectothiorhodospira]AHK77874.1 hypothetical protein M911_00135 [Ectothiorhodospira haloalkaliphila]MCG5495016.1 DUF4168 domain-containing protein [Ectothiorhodospira variabilis]MCG5496359.1 DUF4168 domain-containing protein [Ectothiorhodospira variabilis]MCG5504529.1 DUF4168 domain-containing protein [Ectothiorhodospira variabilis]MCG5507605.1 DUF4168 domain-containing protein [Ectothiorhodospira variabilis]